ncbi:Reductase [Handroanthus impetiginosus]|uniref:Reductase n=1 Tax=Handroanthus impetiginosus TaxID=429701 RepID=A0A2G9HUY4_9LAMI|nr:Reductase [Handroanthus impetiginosus]
MEKWGRRFEGKVAIVTASTQGIGFGIAERLGLEGAAVVISSRRQRNVDEAVEKLKGRGIEVLGLVCHVSNAQQRKDLIAKTVEKGSSIVFISSVAGYQPHKGLAMYGVTKTALFGLTKALAAEMAPNTRVNCIAPGFVPTHFASFLMENESTRRSIEEKTLLNRLGTIQDMAAATAYLASDDAAYVTGETLIVAGGVPSRL